MRRIYAYNDGRFSAVNESRAEKPVTKENADYVARKVKAASGVKVCFDESGNMRRCADNKLIVRSALNGKHSIEDLSETAKKLGECTECCATKNVKKVAECNGNKKPVKESLCSVFDNNDDNANESVSEEDKDAPKAAVRESVASRFAKYRKLYEDEILTEKSEGDDDSDGDDDLNFDNLFGDSEPKDNGDEDKKDGDEEEKKGDEDEKKDDDDEEVPITAIVITITDKDKLDDFKDKLVDAGIDESDIEIIDGEDDDKEGKVRITVNAFDELKKFLKDEYDMDLEEELGGEVVTDDDDEKKEDEKKDDEGDGENKDGDDDGDDAFNFDNIDLFGDDESGDDNKE